MNLAEKLFFNLMFQCFLVSKINVIADSYFFKSNFDLMSDFQIENMQANLHTFISFSPLPVRNLLSFRHWVAGFIINRNHIFKTGYNLPYLYRSSPPYRPCCVLRVTWKSVRQISDQLALMPNLANVAYEPICCIFVLSPNSYIDLNVDLI